MPTDEGVVRLTGSAERTTGRLAPRGAGRRLESRRVVDDIVCLTVAGSAAVTAFSTALSPLISLPLAGLAALMRLPQWRFNAADYLAALLAALTLSSIWWTRANDLTAQHSLRMGGALLLFVALRVAMVQRRDVLAGAAGYVLGCAYSILLLVRENSLTGIDWRFDSIRTYTVEGLNQNYVAYALAAGVAMLAFLVGTRVRPWFLFPVLVTLYLGIGLTGSRGGLFAFVLAGVWWLIPKQVRARSWKPMAASACILAVALTTGWLDDVLRKLFKASQVRETGELNGRLNVWPIARDVIVQDPIIGAGAGSFPSLNPWAIYAHNAILDVGSGLGSVGITVFVTLLACILVREPKHASTSERHLCVGVTFLVLLPPLMSGYWYASPAIWVLLAVCSKTAVAYPAVNEAASSGGEASGSSLAANGTPAPPIRHVDPDKGQNAK